MRLRSLAVPACCTAALLAVLLPTTPAASQAPPTLATINALDNRFATDSGGDPNVTIAAGGHVNFVYFMGNSRHNVAFTGAKPSACGISEGPPGNTSALPTVPSPSLWEGGCDFDAPGTYPFVCELHSSMRGSVTAVATGASPPPPPGSPPVVQGPQELAPAASGVKVTTKQRGFSVRGSVLVARSGARVVARAYARRRALFTGSRSVLEVRVGRQSRVGVRAGRATFSAPLNAVARRALRRNGRLLITLRLTVTPAAGTPYKAARTVILRPR